MLVVAENSLRSRARDYLAGLRALWPRSRVVFASKAFPCTAVQRVMVEEGVGLDVAGTGEILTASGQEPSPGRSSCTAMRNPQIDAYLDALVGAAREHLPAEAELIIEPGRSMVGSAGSTVYRVTTVKRSAGRTFVAVDGGMGDNLEVALFEQRFKAAVVDRFGGGADVTLVGRTASLERF